MGQGNLQKKVPVRKHPGQRIHMLIKPSASGANQASRSQPKGGVCFSWPLDWSTLAIPLSQRNLTFLHRIFPCILHYMTYARESPFIGSLSR
jgi:hypothetical protein